MGIYFIKIIRSTTSELPLNTSSRRRTENLSGGVKETPEKHLHTTTIREYNIQPSEYEATRMMMMRKGVQLMKVTYSLEPRFLDVDKEALPLLSPLLLIFRSSFGNKMQFILFQMRRFSRLFPPDPAHLTSDN